MGNTNIDGTRNIMFAMTAIRGIGRRFSNLICKKADIDLSKRAGQLDDDEIRRMETIIQNPRLVLEQTKGLEGRHLWPVYLQRSRHQAPRGFGASQEDPCPPWSPPSLAPPCPWSAYQDHWSPWPHRRCLQEEVGNMTNSSLSTIKK